jgi:glycosyltransferase involved in cell wall biosynthesis
VKRVAIFTGKAPSLKVVAEDLSLVASEYNFAPLVFTDVYPDVVYRGKAQAAILFYPMDPVFAIDKATYYYEFNKALQGAIAWYTTVEGEIYREHVNVPVWNYVEFIANSQYTREKLQKRGLDVIMTIPHGVHKSTIEQAKKLVPSLRKRIESEFKGTVTFLVVSSSHRRKNMEGLAKAMDILTQKQIFNYTVLGIVEGEPPHEAIFKVAEYGSKPRYEVVAAMASVDYVLMPTQCEGFGLPLIEANAMGTPVLHGLFPPLSEFTDTEANITWQTQEIEYLPPDPRKGGGILFELHKFPPEAIADAIIEAIDIRKNYPSKYEDMRSKALENAKKYDSSKLYSRIFEEVISV